MGLRHSDRTDEQFIAEFAAAGHSPAEFSRQSGIALSAIYRRLNRLREKGHYIPTIAKPGAGRSHYAAPAQAYQQRKSVAFRDGSAVIFSDAHWWPGQPRTVAHEALLKVLATVRPGLVIANGDVFDGAASSRHEPRGWENRPTVMAELETVKEHMAAIEAAAPGARLLRTIGNHDERFDTRLAVRVPDYRHLAGMMLRDHLPAWDEAWSFEINAAVMVKHRWHTGIHATYNNVLKAGRSIITSHNHRLKVEGFTDYNGRRWAVDTGSLSQSEFAQFNYAEDNPKNWGSGFAVLTFINGEMQPPELCEVVRGRAFFRGEVIHEQAAKRVNFSRRVRAGGNESGTAGHAADRLGNGRRADGAHVAAKSGGSKRPVANAVRSAGTGKR